MEKELKAMQDFFALINLSKFCTQYDISYDHFYRVLKGERKLTDKFYEKFLEAKEKFHNKFFS